MVLKLVDTRIEKNSKCEMYIGEYFGIPVDVVKVYKRATAVHQFKLTVEMYQWKYSDSPFSTFSALKDKFRKDLSEMPIEEYHKFMFDLQQNEINNIHKEAFESFTRGINRGVILK
jgi:hypothetical protein